jgi:hypothetical protein
MLVLNLQMCLYRTSRWFIGRLASPSALLWRKDSTKRYLIYLAEGYFGKDLMLIELYLSDYGTCFSNHMKDVNIAAPAVLLSFCITCHVRNERAFANSLYNVRLNNMNLTQYLRLESLAATAMNFKIFWEMTLLQFTHTFTNFRRILLPSIHGK